MCGRFKTFQAAVDELMSTRPEVCHEFIYYVEQPMTLTQWVALDDAMSQAFAAAGIDDDKVIGLCGPIPDMDTEREPMETTGRSMTSEEFLASLADDDGMPPAPDDGIDSDGSWSHDHGGEG